MRLLPNTLTAANCPFVLRLRQPCVKAELFNEKRSATIQYFTTDLALARSSSKTNPAFAGLFSKTKSL